MKRKIYIGITLISLMFTGCDLGAAGRAQELKGSGVALPKSMLEKLRMNYYRMLITLLKDV